MENLMRALGLKITPTISDNVLLANCWSKAKGTQASPPKHLPKIQSKWSSHYKLEAIEMEVLPHLNTGARQAEVICQNQSTTKDEDTQFILTKQPVSQEDTKTLNVQTQQPPFQMNDAKATKQERGRGRAITGMHIPHLKTTQKQTQDWQEGC